MGLPYTIELRNFPDEGCFARVKELSGCMSQGDTVAEAVANIQEAMQLWLEVALDHGDTIPEPRPDEDYSGKFVVRVPRSLHRELAEAARREGISLNQYINVALAQAVGGTRPPHARSGLLPLSEQVNRLESLLDRLENTRRMAWSALDAASDQPLGGHAPTAPGQLVVHEEQSSYQAPEGDQAAAEASPRSAAGQDMEGPPIA